MSNVYGQEIEPSVRRMIDSFLLSVSGSLENNSIQWHSLNIERLPMDQGLLAKSIVDVNGTQREIRIEDREISDPRYQQEDWDRRSREMVRRVVMESLGLKLPWGILTGVRPSKLYHLLRQKGFSADEVEERLRRIYQIDGAKAALLREVGELQRPFIERTNKEIGIYIGIPFCPTRCRYCSFASHPLSTHGHLVKGFLEALVKELEWAKDFCHEVGWQVGAIYIGGGTPTTLSASQFQPILRKLAQIPQKAGMEFTIEAGRPETIHEQHLEVFGQWGVNRISVNPQTMHDETLRRIGRAHLVDDVYKAVERVRKAHIPNMNMDMIAGLPGESVSHLEYTLDEILKFQPESLTIHTLAPKRAAEWSQDELEKGLNDEELMDWLESARDKVRFQGLNPYYLYRQRRILANQENVGYALSGAESLYNIWMMEECRTILGLGGGAVTKWVDPSSGFVDRRSNPKCPATFMQGISEEISKKTQWLKGYLN
jgi:oxygen-independent coproporphyrinogen-3 oxidase